MSSPNRDELLQEQHDLQDQEREEKDDIEDEEGLKNESGELPIPNDEEDDDEDDDDDDDDEDRVQNRKRARRDRNQFLDVEAEVSDDEDDDEEDEDELAKEGFIANDQDNEEAVRRDDRLHRQVDRSHEKSTEEDAQKLAAQFKERYGRANKYRGDDSGFVSQRFLLPSINDPSIWAVRCRQGKEKEIVRKLLKRKLTLLGKPNEPKFLSAFQRDNFTGYIYIEADKLTAVDLAIRGFPDIYASNKILVPVEEFPNLLRANKSSDVRVEPGSYVRIKRGKYKGDLAIVDAVEENGLEVTLQIVPRIDYKGETDEETGKRKRATAKARPPQRLFSKKDALEYDKSNFSMKTSNSVYYKGEEYIDGYLFKSFKLQFLETQNVQPRLEEVSRFNTGDDDNLDLTSIAQSLKSSKETVFNTGDRVQVLQGEQQGLQGDVVSSANDTVLIKPIGFQSSNLEFPINNLRKIFHNGDHISVIKGNHNGHTGIVVSVDNDHVTFISDQSHKDITVFANNLTKSTDSSTLIDGLYDLHDLVRLNATTVGVVIKADKDVFTVLSQEGKILSLSPTAIISKVDIRKDQAFAADSQGNPIKIGDSVSENGGFKRRGNILHIYRLFLFVYSKETAENNGIFVTQISSVINNAAKSVNEEEDKNKKLDLTKMNPKFRSGGNMAPPAVPIKPQSGRDNTINKHVSIRLGEYKGLRGIIKDTNGDIARVELHTKNKIINISKTKLSFVTDDNRLIPYDDYVRNSSIRGGTTYTNSSATTQPSSGASSNWAGTIPSRPSATVGNGGGTAWGGAGTQYAGGAGTQYGGGTSWGGAAGGSGTAWGGRPTAGAGSSWGGANSGSQWGGGTQHGAGSQWGGNNGANTGYGTAYGGGTAWGARSSYGNKPSQNTWNTAATPGSFQQAETPGANYNNAQTPYDDYSYDNNNSAPTPGFAPTPGAEYRD